MPPVRHLNNNQFRTHVRGIFCSELERLVEPSHLRELPKCNPLSNRLKLFDSNEAKTQWEMTDHTLTSRVSLLYCPPGKKLTKLIIKMQVLPHRLTSCLSLRIISCSKARKRELLYVSMSFLRGSEEEETKKRRRTEMSSSA